MAKNYSNTNNSIKNSGNNSYSSYADTQNKNKNSNKNSTNANSSSRSQNCGRGMDSYDESDRY